MVSTEFGGVFGYRVDYRVCEVMAHVAYGAYGAYGGSHPQFPAETEPRHTSIMLRCRAHVVYCCILGLNQNVRIAFSLSGSLKRPQP